MRRIWIPLIALSWIGCGAEDGGANGANGADPESPTASWLSDLGTGEAATGLASEAMRSIEASGEAGQAVYASNCVPCHGAEGEGRLGIGPQLRSTSFLAAASDDYLLRTIARGRAGTTMPGWASSLERGQVESVIAYMRSWEEVEPAELDEVAASGDAEAGAATFREICAACHGQEGAGYQETANGTGIGRAAFLADTSNGYLRYMIRNGKTDTPMRPFGRPSATAVANLTDEQIENVIAHLRAAAW